MSMRRTALIRKQNLPLISRWKMMGFTLQEIFEKLNEHNKGLCDPISMTQLQHDLGTCKKIWANMIAYSQNEMRYDIKAQLERVKLNAWRAYEQSCQKSNRTVAVIDEQTKKPLGGQLTVTQETRYGDVRCLETVLRTLDMEAKLFGLYPTQPIEIVGEKKINVAFVVDTKGKTLQEVANFPIEGAVTEQKKLDKPQDYDWDSVGNEDGANGENE